MPSTSATTPKATKPGRSTGAKPAPRKRGKPGPKVPPRREPGRPGSPSRILNGFDRAARTWGPESTAGRFLTTVSWGATLEHAAGRARIHPAQPRRWKARGEDLLIPDPETVLDLDQLDTVDVDHESFACAVFALEYAALRPATVLAALETIAREAATDWRAAALALRVHPEGKPYREVSRHEHTGEDGGPVTVDVGDEALRHLVDLAAQFAADDADTTA